MTGVTLAIVAVTGAAVLWTAARHRWLTRSGVAAAGLVGIAVAWGLGLPGLGVLVFFFVTSSALTRLLRSGDHKADADGGGRTASQVFANAGIASASALAAGAMPRAELPVIAFAGALAAATADTWASEVGESRRASTRLITTWERVDPGVDGGVSWPGSAAAVGASAAVALLASRLLLAPGLFAAVALGGVAGMLIDSIAGATLQGRHDRVGNDVINWLATAAGAAVAIVLGTT